MMLARFGSADEELAAKEFLVVQLRHCALRFFDGEHLHKGETFRPLVMLVGHNFRVLHLPNPVEELEEVTFRGFKREVADVKTRRGDFD